MKECNTQDKNERAETHIHHEQVLQGTIMSVKWNQSYWVWKQRKWESVVKMEAIEVRAVVKYFLKKGLTAKVIHADFVETLGNNASAYSTVTKWVREFGMGRETVKDAPRTGRPVTATTPETITAIHTMVMADRRVTIRRMVEMVGVSYGTVQAILRDVLEVHKVSARWVPRQLTPDQKQTRVTSSEENLDVFQADPQDFLARYVTMDETWVHHFDPETKLQSKQWRH